MARWIPLLFLLPSLSSAGSADFLKEMQPRTITLRTDGITLSEALTLLREQTGNAVVDRRKERTDQKLKLNLDNAPFWKALETIAEDAGCGISLYQADGQVALVDTPHRSLPTFYQGIFRIRIKRSQVALDLEAAARLATVTLEIAWEPRFEPLYLDAGPLQVTYGQDAKRLENQVKSAPQGKMNVAGRNAVEIDFRLPAPHRSVGQIKTLQGQFQLTGPAKMLAFSFPKLKAFKRSEGPMVQTQEGVQVSVAEVKTFAKRWFVEVHIDNPKGNPELESYQSWLTNNRISLEKSDLSLTPRPGDEEIKIMTGQHAEIVYSFSTPPGQPSDYLLHYRTPGRIGITEVPFTFQNLELP